MITRESSIVVTAAAPDASAEVLCAALRRASGVQMVGGPGASFLEPDTAATQRALEMCGSHRLTAADADRLGIDAEALLSQALGTAANDAGTRVLAGARNALRVSLLAATFPHARFVICQSDPARSISEMIARWRSHSYVSVPDLEGWTGEPWSLPLVPDWRGLASMSLTETVVHQWVQINTILLDDLEAIDPSRWAVCRYAALLADPRVELQRICGFAGLRYDQALLTPAESAARRTPPPRPAKLTDDLLALTDGVAARWRELLPMPKAGVTRAAPPAPSLFAGNASPSFVNVLRTLGASLLVTTYQSGKLICLRARDGQLNTHFRDFDKPMGLAVRRDRLALATRAELWDFRDFPAVLGKLEPAGHDACYLPRNRHVTGDALMHELVYHDGELWGAATKFSCLVSFDADHSFVPRWRPKFIPAVADGDRCHLNGICVDDGKIVYVSALGSNNEPHGWREKKATGGVLIDVASSEIACAGLSMPHSPRLHDGKLYVLESGYGSLNVVDLNTGSTERLVELPGFTRGLALAGRYAFIGLSQIREASTFGDLPLTDRLQERVCGIWVVDLGRLEIIALLRFDGIVQEIFDVQLMPGVRFPEIAEPSSSATTTSFKVP